MTHIINVLTIVLDKQNSPVKLSVGCASIHVWSGAIQPGAITRITRPPLITMPGMHLPSRHNPPGTHCLGRDRQEPVFAYYKTKLKQAPA